MTLREHLALIDSCIVRAALLAGLPHLFFKGGADMGMMSRWTWHLHESPENVTAAVEVLVSLDEANEGVEIKVYSEFYERGNRAEEGSSRMYYGRYVRFDDLVPQTEDIVSGLQEKLRHAWQELPNLVSSIPRLKEERRVFMEGLKRSGLLQD